MGREARRIDTDYGQYRLKRGLKGQQSWVYMAPYNHSENTQKEKGTPEINQKSPVVSYLFND